MDRHFKTQQDFLNAVNKAISVDDQPALQDAIIEGVCHADNALAEWEEQENAGQELRLGRWFIRNEDFPFFQLLGSIAAGLLALAATGGAHTAALVTPVTNFASACWQVRRKGAKLTAEQVAVFGVLSANQGISVQEITDKLASLGRVTTAKQLQETLHSLLGLELYDGTVVPLIRVDDEKWRALHI